VRRPEALRKRNVVFVQPGSDLHLRYMATASHLVNNATFPTWFVRRPEQRYLNTWHGTPWKTLGRDMRGRFMEHKTFVRNILQATHLISPNPHTTRILLQSHEVQGICPAILAETGYPRVDLTLSRDEAALQRLRAALGLREGEEVVLYAPTWRGEHGSLRIDAQALRADLQSMRAPGRRVLFRGHSLVEKLIIEALPDVEVVPREIDSNELLSLVDVLVTDYSSILFDYLPLGRRIVLYVPDLDEYSRERGMYFGIDEVPGIVCESRDALLEAMRAPWGADAFADGMRKFCSMEDGEASARVARFFFDGDDSLVRSRPGEASKALVYAGDFLANGITSSCLNLLRSVPEGSCTIVLAIDPDVIQADPVRMRKFGELPAKVQVVCRHGQMLFTPDEKWLLDQFNTHHALESPEQREVLARAFAREFTRVFGALHFDALVEFEGYIRFWMSMFAFGGGPGVHRAAYLHNDMRKEHELRFPYLKAIFSLYAQY